MKLVCQTDELLQHWVISPQERNLALNDRTVANAIRLALLLK